MKCDTCNEKMSPTSNLTPNNEEIMTGAHRVEGYKCKVLKMFFLVY